MLVSTDFSLAAGHAIDRVALLPLDPGASVVICHTLPDGVARNLQVETHARRALEESAERLDSAVRAAGRTDLEIGTLLGRGRPCVETVRLASDGEVDLVVLGRVGDAHLRDTLMGSTAENVIASARVPVLLVERRPWCDYVRPAAAVDPYEAFESLVVRAEQLAGSRSSRIELLHAAPLTEYEALARNGASGDVLQGYVDETHRRANTALCASVAGLPPPSRPLVPALRLGDPRTIISGWVEERRIDLLVTGTHHRGALTRALLGSVAARVIRTVSCDTLVVPMNPWGTRRR